MEPTSENESEVGQDGYGNKDLPVVFQCTGCNVILSDSEGFVAANDDLKSITVNRISSCVKLSSKLVTSIDGIDQGSTYTPLVCAGCEASVGKVYRTTARPLDDLRDAYTFNVNKLSVYQLGSGSVTVISDNESFVESHTSLKALKETTLKLQVLMCAMHQRIANIEQSLEMEEMEASEMVEKPPTDLTKSARAGNNKARQPTQQDRDRRSVDRDGELDHSGEKVVRGRDNGYRERGGKVTQPPERGDLMNRLNVDSPQSSDSEGGSGSRGLEWSRTGKGSGKEPGKGQRGDGAASGAASSSAKSRSRKRTKAAGDVVRNGSEAVDQDIGMVSPIRKKPNSRAYRSYNPALP